MPQKMRKNSYMILWFPNQDYPMFTDILSKRMTKFDRIPAVWAKNTAPAGDLDKTFSRSYEAFFVAWKGDPVLQLKGLSNVFTTSYSSGKLSMASSTTAARLDD